MTTALTPLGSLSGLISPARSTAKSESAQSIKTMQEQIRRHLLDSYMIRRVADQALSELEEVEEEASYDGWNGYGGKRIDLQACAFAKAFLTALPTTAPVPEISADGDGEVALDWIFGDRRALTVSIGPTGRCTFACIRGESAFRGTDWMTDGIPATIAYFLGRLASESSQQGQLSPSASVV